MKIKHVSKHTLFYIILFLLLITSIQFIERVLMVKTVTTQTTTNSTIDPKKSCAGCNGGPLKFIILLATFLYGTYYEDDDDLPHKNSGITTIQATQLLSPREIGSPQQVTNNRTTQKRKEDYQSHRRRMTMINDSFLK